MNENTHLPPPPVNGDFVTEGFFLALPASFPGVSRALDAAETRIRRLAFSTRGDLVFGITAGPRPHLIQWAPRGTYGYAVDCGVPEGALEIDALAAFSIPGKNLDRLMVSAWDGSHTTLWRWGAPLIGHGIQEWNVVQYPPRPLCTVPGLRITDMAWSGEDGCVLALAGRSCFCFRPTEDAGLAMGRIPLPDVQPNLLALSPGVFHVLSCAGELLRLDPVSGRAVVEAAWGGIPPVHCVAGSGWITGVDDRGRVFEWRGGSSPPTLRGVIPLAPVSGLGRLADGRIFAAAGPDIAHWYVLEGEGGYARDLGVPVSTLTARRYGLQLGPMLIGRGGEIYLAENDRGGHLWIYFPEHRIHGRPASG